VLVVPDKMSTEKVLHLKAMGAEVHMTRSDVGNGHPDYYQDRAARVGARDPRRVLREPVRQPGQPRARTRPATGPEIWEQMKHDVDAIVVGGRFPRAR